MDLEYSALLLDELRELAVTAASEAATLAAAGRREGVVIAGTKSIATDIVTETSKRFWSIAFLPLVLMTECWVKKVPRMWALVVFDGYSIPLMAR